jgi:hypothetical protein
VCGLLLPIAYVAFWKLQGNRAYLGDDLPRPGVNRLWRAGMLLSTTVLVVALVWFLKNDVPGWIEKVTAG